MATVDVDHIAAGLTNTQRNAVLAAWLLVPAYRDGGLIHSQLIAMKLAKPVLGGVALTALGRRVRVKLMDSHQ